MRIITSCKHAFKKSFDFFSFVFRNKILVIAFKVLFGKEVSFNSLNKLAYFCSYNNFDHLYQRLLCKYDVVFRDFSKRISDYKFIPAKGSGVEVINHYRKVKVDNIWCFEKVFRTGSLGFLRSFMSNEINELHKHKFILPIIYSIKCRHLSLIYYPFVETKTNLSCSDILNLSKAFSIFSYKNLQVFKTNNRCFIDSYDSEFIVKDGLQKAKAIVEKSVKNNILEQILSNQKGESKKIFSHGDIFSMNVLNNQLIDFDRSGFYPIGYDYAYTIVKELEYPDVKKINSLVDDYCDYFCDQDKINLKINMYLFMILHYSRKRKSSKHIPDDAFIIQLYTKLVSFYKKVNS